MKFKNNVAVVTSSSADINRACVIDFAKTYSFLASDYSCYTTGVYLNIDGGMPFS